MFVVCDPFDVAPRDQPVAALIKINQSIKHCKKVVGHSLNTECTCCCFRCIRRRKGEGGKEEEKLEEYKEEEDEEKREKEGKE